MALKDYLIEILIENKVFEQGHFVLASGKESDYYVNMKKAITNPLILKTIGEMITEAIENDDIDKIAGPALGAVPIATASSILSDIPLLMIRKEKKSYGTSKQIEGELNEGDNVIVVEDVTTIVKRAFVCVDREEGAIEKFKKEGIKLEPLISVSDFFNH